MHSTTGHRSWRCLDECFATAEEGSTSECRPAPKSSRRNSSNSNTGPVFRQSVSLDPIEFQAASWSVSLRHRKPTTDTVMITQSANSKSRSVNGCSVATEEQRLRIPPLAAERIATTDRILQKNFFSTRVTAFIQAPLGRRSYFRSLTTRLATALWAS